MIDWTDEDIKEFKRLSNLYYSLSEEEKRYIVTQWDNENGLKCWQERLEEKETKPQKDKRRNRLMTIGVIALLIIGFFAGEQYWRLTGQHEGYIACRTNFEVAMEEYPSGLYQKVMADFKRIEDDVAMTSYGTR